MKLDAHDLKEAAAQRITTARHLFETGDHDTKHYSSAIYIAGVAVECILRAYRFKQDPQFDSRHDLAKLLRASGFVGLVPEKRKKEVSAALGDVWARWKNEYRYASDRRLLGDLKDRGLTAGIRGDQLKENARIVIERAYELVNVGVAQWKSV